MVTITAVTPGNTAVTVTATDPEGLKGQQAFQVTVPNRSPLARGKVPDQTIIAGRNAVVNLSTYFTEGDYVEYYPLPDLRFHHVLGRPRTPCLLATC